MYLFQLFSVSLVIYINYSTHYLKFCPLPKVSVCYSPENEALISNNNATNIRQIVGPNNLQQCHDQLNEIIICYSNFIFKNKSRNWHMVDIQSSGSIEGKNFSQKCQNAPYRPRGVY